MFEVESVPSRDNAPCLLLLLSMHNVLKNDRVQSLRLQTPQSDPLSIYTQQFVSNGIYTH